MKTPNINGHKVERRLVEHLEGAYLCQLADWSEDVAKALASQGALILSEKRGSLLNGFRQYYNDYTRLFPKGHHQAARISGIDLPSGYGYTI